MGGNAKLISSEDYCWAAYTTLPERQQAHGRDRDMHTERTRLLNRSAIYIPPLALLLLTTTVGHWSFSPPLHSLILLPYSSLF
jgi:hypothetical protein